MFLCVLDHAVEGGAFLRSGTAHALVYIDFVKFPQRVAQDVLVEIPLLAFQRIGLVELVGGHTAVGCDSFNLIVEWIDHIYYLLSFSGFFIRKLSREREQSFSFIFCLGRSVIYCAKLDV